jgi:hypothetical protein
MHIKVPDKVHATFPGNYKGGKTSFILKNTYLTLCTSYVGTLIKIKPVSGKGSIST